jgi:co-chaperonin GroES (HSP10)
MNQSKSNFEIPDTELDFMSYLTNIGRVVSIGPCCWTRPEHKTSDGKQFDWVQVGDFVSYPKNTGAKRKFKGVSYVLLVDDEIVERLPDPQVFDDDFYKIDIPQEDLEKYNTIYKKGK